MRLGAALRDLARDRVANLVAASTSSHAGGGGSIDAALAGGGIQHWSCGEAIGWTSAPWGTDAAASIYRMFRQSSSHWTLLMSRTFNYVGIGVGERARDHKTFVSIIFTESRDHTAPIATMTGATRSETTISFQWSGRDRLLQTHTAGLRDFDVEYRVDDGPWCLVRDSTTATGASWADRPRGHTYALRVRSRDRAGNLSAWSSPMSVSVP